MESICPHCNGFSDIKIHCPACSNLLSDHGTLQETLGPYAPYEENSASHNKYGCVHQVFCYNCQTEYFYTVRG